MRTRIVVLAAGKGTRMKQELPKVLTPFHGKPMVQHLLDSIKESAVDPRPLLVIAKDGDIVRSTLGDQYDYAIQEKQLGTGHAVAAARSALEGSADAVIVLYGDHPLVTALTIKRLHDLHEEKKCVLTMVTTHVPDFEEWRSVFYDFGRIVRDEHGNIQAIVEKKDAAPDELLIKEVNPSFFCFNAAWLWRNLPNLGNNNAQQEYYLTDLVRIAIDEGEPIASMDVSPLETTGVNTQEHLELTKRLKKDGVN